ncbi:methyl-accepting chemotaxis protein [Ideonella sp.]|uniref:methyl-accepting chemotaxis protein n=1 Tax=Ideonella sp. TaxID=1929293 RepID=UPI0035B29717
MPFTTVRAKLIAASVGTVTVAMALLAGINLFVVQRAARAAADERIASVADSNARQLGEWVAARTDVIVSLAPAVDAADALPALVQARTAGRYDTTYIGWADKRHVFSSPQNLPADWDPTSRPWYQQAAAAGKPVLTSPYVDAGTGKLVVTFAAPVAEGGSVKAVTAGDLFIDGVVQAVRSIRPTEHSFAYLVDAAGAVIAHPDAQLTLKPAAEVAAGLDGAKLKALRGQAEPAPQEVGGQAYLLSARQVPGTEWTFVLAMHEGDAMAAVGAIRTASAVTALLAIGLAAAVLAGLTTALLRRLGQLTTALQDIASGEGDLTRRLDTRGHDELAQVGASFNAFVDKLAATLRRIQSTTESVNTAASEIASGNQDLSSRTELTASNLQQTASSMEQLTGAVKHTSDAADTARQLAGDAAQAAERGGEVVSRVVSTMQEIQHSSQRIGDIIGVIDGIAFQTNILALNAAVEAARAGEQGRGFAVVAGEVRALAQRSADAAKEIKTLIGTSVDKVEGGTRLVVEAGGSMQEIVSGVKRVSEVIAEISTATREQSQGIGQVGQAVTQLDQMTQQNAALVEESAAAAMSLREQANVLAGAVGAFKLGH